MLPSLRLSSNPPGYSDPSDVSKANKYSSSAYNRECTLLLFYPLPAMRKLGEVDALQDYRHFKRTSVSLGI
jgi:hypothetical protein